MRSGIVLLKKLHIWVSLGKKGRNCVAKYGVVVYLCRHGTINEYKFCPAFSAYPCPNPYRATSIGERNPEPAFHQKTESHPSLVDTSILESLPIKTSVHVSFSYSNLVDGH